MPPMQEAPHDENGFYLCPCGRDKFGTPYNRRSIIHAHGTPKPIDAKEFGDAVVRVLEEARDHFYSQAPAPHVIMPVNPIDQLRERALALQALGKQQSWHNKRRTWGDAFRCFVGKHKIAHSGRLGGDLIVRCSCGAFFDGRRVGWVQLDGHWHGPRKGWSGKP